MEKYICIHGHFYQPPRENPWLEIVEQQEGAMPFHDWNEKIDFECYATNGASRILNNQHKIVEIVNNYANISFNFGATLMSWFKTKSPQTYEKVILGDQQSQINFGGHGSAMAQVYNHIIMPLANKRDKETQIIWGIKDFESHFNRKPEGMWLGEAGVDTETLELLVENGIKFTLLAPQQAKKFRKIGSNEWYNGINPFQHYYCNLPSGKKIALFFYEGEVSSKVAFEGLLNDGRNLANRMLSHFQYAQDIKNPLMHIATDGESYGHHHKYGDMALASCLRHIEENGYAKITNYAEYLSLFEPEYEVEIYENSSWSCVHGVERWRSNCGCETGGQAGWNQKWRKPLREGLNWLRDELDLIFETEMKKYHKNPFQVRNEYINVILNRNTNFVENFLQKHFGKDLDELQKTNVMRLLEMQRQGQLMFASCAWFFCELSGIETVQCLMYANRAIQLGERVSQKILEPKFLEKLSEAKSNYAHEGTGADIYKKYVLPARISLTKVGMHYAVASLFSKNIESIEVLNYEYAKDDFFERLDAGVQKLAMGRTTVMSKITLSRKNFSFVVLYLGQHQIIGSSTEQIPEKEFVLMAKDLKKAFEKSNIAEIIEIMHNHFPTSHNFSILELFKDEKIHVLNQILEDSLKQAQNSYRKIFDKNYNILNLMRLEHLEIPSILKQNLEVVVNQEIEMFFSSKNKDTHTLKSLLKDIQKWNMPIFNMEKISLSASNFLQNLARTYLLDYTQIRVLEVMDDILEFLKAVKIEPNIRNVQNSLFRAYEKMQDDSELFDIHKREDIKKFQALCEKLNMYLVFPKF
jgi:alpha-amylase/alpha-mannosidase (GH57 family)